MAKQSLVAAVAGGLALVGALVFLGVESHSSSVTAQKAVTMQIEASARAARVVTDKAAADKAARDKLAADKVIAAAAAAKAKAAKAAQALADRNARARERADERTALQARATVKAYFAAINAGNYRTAWDLGGKNFNSSYGSFLAGFDNNYNDMIDISGVSGNRVYVTLTAVNMDCTTQVWTGYYVVSGEVLTDAHLKGGKFQPLRYCD